MELIPFGVASTVEAKVLDIFVLSIVIQNYSNRLKMTNDLEVTHAVAETAVTKVIRIMVRQHTKLMDEKVTAQNKVIMRVLMLRLRSIVSLVHFAVKINRVSI